MATLNIEKKLLRNGVTLLVLSGELDAHTAPSLDTTITDLLKGNNVKLIIDLHDVSYISSHGIGILVSAQSRASEKQGSIVLMKPTPLVKEVFAMLEVAQIFPVVEDQEAALAAF
jgi:anti-sigma B factor antagonist